MKKIIILLSLISSFHLFAQKKLFKGAGVFGALTVSKHEYNNLDTDKKDTTYVYKDFFPQSHVSKEFLNWGAGAFLELGKENLRWQTELEYANKGANEMGLTNAFTGARTGSFVKEKLTYFQWNNYAKFYNKLGYAHWYFMPGIRLEYLFKSSANVFPGFSNSFPKIWFSGNVAVGYEFHLVKNISAFFETHWNPDIISHKNDNTKIRNRTFEARGGLVYRPRKRRIDDCNTPTYRGPAY